MSKSKRKDWCSAVKCKSSGAKYPDLSFFRFPKDEKRCMEWVEQCGRKDLLGKSAKYLYTNCRICSKHFEQKQILNTGRLVWNAVPTKFKHQHKKPRRRQRERAKQIHEKSGPLGQRLKKKLAHLDTVNGAEKQETVIRQEPLSKYLKFTEKDIEMRITEQRQNTRSRNLQNAEKVTDRSETDFSQEPPSSDQHISDKDTERSETDSSQEPTSSDPQISDDNVTVIEMDHSYINPDSELSEGHQETITLDGIQCQTLKEDQQKTTGEMQSPQKGRSEHSNQQLAGQTSRTVYVKNPHNATLKTITGSQNVPFQLVRQDTNSQTTRLEVLNEERSCFLLSPEASQQEVLLSLSCPSASKVIQPLPTNLPNEISSHSVREAAQVNNPRQKAKPKVVQMQPSSKTTQRTGHWPQIQPHNAHIMTSQSQRLQEQTVTNIKNVHHEEIVVAAKRTGRSRKRSSSTLRVRLFRAKLKIKKLEAALEKIKKRKSRHRENKKRALKDISWVSSTSNQPKPHGRRYSERHKRFAIGLYKQSRKAYQFCRKELSLPSVRSLQEWMKKDKVKAITKAKDVLSESVAACVPLMDSLVAVRGSAEEDLPEIVVLVPDSEQEKTEAASGKSEQYRTEVLVETLERGETFADRCRSHRNRTELVICTTEQDGREEISLPQAQVVKVVEAFMSQVKTT